MAQTRADIIKKASGLIKSKGYNNTSINDILEAADIGKGQFYYYFSSKKELGLAVTEHFSDSFNKNLIEGILSSGKDPKERFSEMLEWIIRLHSKREAKCGYFFGNLALEMSEHDEEFRQKINAVFIRLQEKLIPVFSEMVGDCASAYTEQIENLARSIVALIEGGIMMMKSSQDIKDLKKVAATAEFLVDAFVSRCRSNPDGTFRM
jgi:TetR/AcrR family transcriptional repressor of nem operon